MKRAIRVWTGLGLAALAGSQAASADDASRTEPPASAYLQLADNSAEGEGSGEGEGGEGGEGAAKSATIDDAAYLTQLALMQGHLRVGGELYAAGASDMALTHMKHPSDELYTDLAKALAERGVPGFEKELETLANAVESKAPADDVAVARAAVDAAILKAMAIAKADLATTFKVATGLLRNAAEEFEIGVKSGKIVNLHEYQDAYGFTQIARQMIETAKAASAPDQAQIIDAALAEFDALRPVWPDITGVKPVSAEAKSIAVAAAKIELLGYEFK